MATLSIPDEHRTLTDPVAIKDYLHRIHIGYDQWFPTVEVAQTATADEILAAYAADLAPLKERGGYVHADVVNISRETPNLEQMLNRFNREHTHDEDEVRFTLAGHGLFHIHPVDAPVVAVEVAAGDLLVVPKGTRHWFNLCRDRQIKAIRLFQDSAGWTPCYTQSQVEEQYQPLCLGPNWVEAMV
ncbi:cupin domain-containing protein [Lyngbya confervoides]|uniref:Acireductone dioxygenase n=1 Tax=Lyngbya confervoides BDU141951 TaxID=1574623 RepID=A0ABD4T2X8_9CYAN|nr:cupin domain-containing protein [Lyngbya confervoides]MCM1982705.1 cupin domain-containing protein [Lyngbya confervoides BDU141951]